MSYIRTDFSFPDRTAVLQIPLNNREYDRFRAAAKLNEPETVETWVRDILAVYRPDLKDCVLWGLDFNMRTLCVEALAQHPSFPVRLSGEEGGVIQIKTRGL